MKEETSPVCEKIIKSNIQRVVFSLKDPDKRVNGKGKINLREMV